MFDRITHNSKNKDTSLPHFLATYNLFIVNEWSLIEPYEYVLNRLNLFKFKFIFIIWSF